MLPDKKTLALLKAVYANENAKYNLAEDRLEHLVPDAVTRADLDLLTARGLAPNNFETFEHDSSLERLLALKHAKKLTLDFAASLFLKGLAGEIPRARQTLLSFLYLKHLSAHQFTGDDSCTICGLPLKETEDKTHTLYTYYLGHSWNESLLNCLIELEEIIQYDKPAITNADRTKLAQLLNFIEQADADETPGKLEKRIAAAKLLEQTDKYKRYGILQTLAECGILPNELVAPKYDTFTTHAQWLAAGEKLTTSHRSDIVLPLGGWKGKLGVNRKRAEEIFDGI